MCVRPLIKSQYTFLNVHKKMLRNSEYSNGKFLVVHSFFSQWMNVSSGWRKRLTCHAPFCFCSSSATEKPSLTHIDNDDPLYSNFCVTVRITLQCTISIRSHNCNMRRHSPIPILFPSLWRQCQNGPFESLYATLNYFLYKLILSPGLPATIKLLHPKTSKSTM